jgi:hypothetical protein
MLGKMDATTHKGFSPEEEPSLHNLFLVKISND